VIGSTREERKLSALLRAKLSLKQAFERIDYAEDVVKPEVLALRELAKSNVVEIEAGPEDLDAGEGSTDGFGV